MSVYSRAVHFFEQVVEPDHHDAWQHPESLRHAFHYCVSLFSLRDWVFHEFALTPVWAWGTNDPGRFQNYLEGQCPEFAIVSDVANSAKHLRLTRSKTGGITGADHVALYGSAAISGGPISSVPTLEVVVGGTIHPLLHTAEKSLFMWRRLFIENNWD